MGYLEQAKLLILDYTGMSEEEFDNIPVMPVYQEQLAEVLENRDGTQGESSRSEGDISRSFEAGLIPESIEKFLKPHRKSRAKGLNY